MLRTTWITVLTVVLFLMVVPLLAESPNDCFPNGSFEQLNPDGKVNRWESALSRGNRIEVIDGNHVLRFNASQGGFDWENPEKVIQNTDYVLTFRVKGEDVKWARLCLWTRLPDQHEPPNGPLFTQPWSGTFDWKTVTLPFHMVDGITRFIIFFDGMNNGGTTWIDDISIHPVNDTPLVLDTNSPSYGSTVRERLTWIWTDNGFKWSSMRMGKDTGTPVTQQNALFRRVINCPAGLSNAKAIFIGDDLAALSINGTQVGANGSAQDVAVYSLANTLKPGKNTISFSVTNNFGPAGLLGRIEWTNAKGVRELVATNELWECSTDGGQTWKPTGLVAAPVPAVSTFSWVYPQVETLKYPLSLPVPADFTTARIAIRGTGSYRVLADDKVIASGASCGQITKADITAGLKGAKTLTVSLEDLCQPPAGQAVVQFQLGDQVKSVTLSDFTTPSGMKAEKVSALFSPSSWPLNVAAFESAATRQPIDVQGHLEDWATTLLAGSTKLFQIGNDDNSSAEFADFAQGGDTVSIPVANAKSLPKGLEGKLRPQETINFALKSVPANGAALVLDVEDADAMVSTVGVFVNGILCGTPQIIGYDQVPGGRLTNRAWVVTLPKERLKVGQNVLTLRLLPSYYRSDLQTPENQAEEYIRVLNLRDRKDNPYPTSSWVQWDTIYLAALAKPSSEPINGRPVWMGTNLGYLVFNGLDPWDGYVLRDLKYLGMQQAGSPIRIGIWDNNQFGKFNATDARLPNNTTVGEHQLATLRELGMRPYLLMDPGRDVNTPDQMQNGLAAKILKRYGQYLDMMEIGNEVDHPNYGWNAKTMAMAYATIQKEAVCGQMAKAYDPDKNLQIMGQGWYHAWDCPTIDAQARKDSPNDPGYTDALSAHDYGKSYIIPAVQYYLMYGVNPPKPIWVTECGSYTGDDTNIIDFEMNLRGNLAYATYVVEYLCHPYDGEMRHFSMLSAQSKDATVLEKARCYRRLIHSYALHGTPLAWQYDAPDTMNDKLVMVNPVDTGKGYKISFVNLSHEAQIVALRVTLPKAGSYDATRYGDGDTVEHGTRTVTLTANPAIPFNETLAPGETVEYFIAPK